MASHVDPAASAAAITFTPKPPVSVNVGRVPTDLYPRIDLDMPIWERAHAFQVNKTAITNVDVDVQTQLDALGAQLNLSSIVDGSRASFMNYYQSNWMNFANLRVQSFHDSAGVIIPPGTCCLPAPNDTTLKPVQDGPVNACRPADVKFVRVSLQLDFAHLITAPVAPGDPAPVTVLRAEFYMELPQTTVQVNNNNGVPRALTTWHGAADLTTLTPEQVTAEILSPCLRDSPILLSNADFNLPGIVRTSHVVIKAEIKKILRLAFNQICHTLFRNLCPNYTDQPFAAVEVIKQSYLDADGNRVSSSVWAYHQRMTLAMRPFISSRVFPVSVCNKFMDGLDPRIRRYFVDRYKDHWKVHDLDAASQIAKLEEIYLAAIGAEEQYRTMNATAREAVGQPIGQTYAAAGAYPSQAENTLARYDSPSSSSPRRSKNHKCFGCGSADHSWQTNGVITCPKGDDPAIQRAAKEAFHKYRDALRKREKSKKELPTKRALTYAELDDEAKKKMAQEVFQAHGTDAASVASSITSPTTSGSSPVNRIHRTLYCSASVPEDEDGVIPILTADGSPVRRALPVVVTNAFPTIDYQVCCGYCSGVDDG
jgi:hypothetical protein